MDWYFIYVMMEHMELMILLNVEFSYLIATCNILYGSFIYMAKAKVFLFLV